MYNGLDLLKSKLWYSGVGRSRIALELREEELKNNIASVTSVDLVNKLVN